MATFNSKQYAWANVRVVLFGREVIGIRGVKYKVSQEKEAVYGAGSKPLGIQAGNKSYEGEVVLLQNELEAIQRAAGVGNDITDIPAFDIQVSYVDKVSGSLVNDTIKYAEFTEAEKGMSQGDKFMEITLPFIALDVAKGV
jgi:hypothetical protein